MDIPALYARLIQAIGDGTGMADSLLHVHINGNQGYRRVLSVSLREVEFLRESETFASEGS